jgi:hypothetical protein
MVHSTCLPKIAHGEPSSSYECTPDADSTIVKPSVMSNAVTAMMR